MAVERWTDQESAVATKGDSEQRNGLKFMLISLDCAICL